MNISKDNKSPDQSFCSFCNKDGHDLDTCQTASRILKEAKEAYASKKKGEREANFKKRQKPKRKPAKAGKTEHAILGSDSDSNDDAAAATSARISASAAQRPSDTSILGLLDLGCSKSMTPHSNMLSEATPSSTLIHLADDSEIKSTKKGYMPLPFNTTKPHSTLLVPDLHKPLISVSGLCDDGLTVVFTKERCNIYNRSAPLTPAKTVGVGERMGNLYYLPLGKTNASVYRSTSSTNSPTLFDWHLRLNHVGLTPLRRILRDLGIGFDAVGDAEVKKCEICIKSKMHQSPFTSRNSYRVMKPGEIIHSDVCSFEDAGREGFK